MARTSLRALPGATKFMKIKKSNVYFDENMSTALLTAEDGRQADGEAAGEAPGHAAGGGRGTVLPGDDL